MFGIGVTELIVIAGVALLFVGPKRLPEMARQFGKLFVQARRATSDVRSAFDDVVRQAEDEMRKEERESIKNLLSGRINLEETKPSEPVVVTGQPEPFAKIVSNKPPSANDDIPSFDTEQHHPDVQPADDKKLT